MVEIKFEQGCDNFNSPPVINEKYIVPSKGEGRGLWADYFDNDSFSGEPKLSRVDRKPNFWWGIADPDVNVKNRKFSVRWSGKLLIRESLSVHFQAGAYRDH